VAEVLRPLVAVFNGDQDSVEDLIAGSGPRIGFLGAAQQQQVGHLQRAHPVDKAL
jgi:hypothetical protein